MKSHGFTLVELLGVIVILSLLVILIFPTVNDVISDSKNTLYQTQINTILNAAYDYTLKNTDYLPNSNEKKYVTLAQLKIEGLIDVDIKNPDNNQKFEDNLVISIHNVGTNYKYSNNNAKLEGNYLYTVETDMINNSSIKSVLPSIIIDGVSQNSNGNYIKILNLNDTLENFSYKAVSSNNMDLTNKVKKYITKNDIAVDKISTSETGIYKINYVVVDDKGYANIAVLNVIIGDTIPPTINFPETTTISKDIMKFDLLKGVSCEDNSGFCDITYSSELDYGVVGIQTLEYTVKDPSGNTITKKRVITIE